MKRHALLLAGLALLGVTNAAAAAVQYKKFGKEDYDRPGLYDMVINTSKVDLETACDLVCQLVAT